MKISVIVRTYNRAYVIADALASILSQTREPSEILVVDDASTDNTRQVVGQFCDPRIRFLRHEHNRGVAAACNTGIDAATGDLVAFLDSDDVWRPEYLERQAGFLDAHPNASAVFSDLESDYNGVYVPSLIRKMRAFPRIMKRLTGEETVLASRDVYLWLLEEVPIKPSAMVVRRAALRQAGRFDEDWRCGEDWEFLLRFVHRTDFGFIDVPLVRQRHFADSTYRQYVIQDKQSLLDLFVAKKPGLRLDPEALAGLCRGISTHCKILGFSYIQAGRRLQALRTYWRGFVHTGEPMMLFRGLASFLPTRYRVRLSEMMAGRALAQTSGVDSHAELILASGQAAASRTQASTGCAK